MAQHGFYYAPDPSSQQVCTIGGNVAENSGGAHCPKYGFTVNHVLEAEIVLADGERAPAGDRLGPRPARSLRRLRGDARHCLAAIPGLELSEPAEQQICCGSAGIYNLVQPEAARELADRKAEHVLASEPDACASGNPGCPVQVTAALRRTGRPLPAFHPVELLDASLSGIPAADLLRRARR